MTRLLVRLGLCVLIGLMWARAVEAEPISRTPPAATRCDAQHPLNCALAIAYWHREALEARAALAWQRTARLAALRRVVALAEVGDVAAWTCIHSGAWPDGRHVARHGEGPWNANTGNGYHGGLQMDRAFEERYGADMLVLYHGDAERWPPRAQIVVAERARSSGRGYKPWPLTARACGLL